MEELHDRALLAAAAASGYLARRDVWQLGLSNAPVDAALGRALWLGGRRDEAMPHLERAFGRCDRFASILLLTRANLLYGRAQEDRGERRRACEGG